MKTPKTLFACTECGYTSAKWLGKCPECGAWNAFEEMTPEPQSTASSAPAVQVRQPAVRFDQLDLPQYMRWSTGTGELDRVLGGGLVEGSVVLLSGEPGIGKSTLLLQISMEIGRTHTVLYVSGEESRGQIKLRYQRLGAGETDIYVLAETQTEAVLQECGRLSPDVIIVDSIQTLYTQRHQSAPGSINQVRESAMAFITYAKNTGAAVFLVGHVNKEGGISGPKVLEHMVDAVLYFEGERTQSYRIVRAIKNRYGSTNEIGVFEMSDRGLVEIPNPSETMMADRPHGASGNCAGCFMEGTRPIITEIQALVAGSVYAAPKRTSDGFDYNRLCLLLAVLEKRLGLRFSEHDVYLNIAGGLRLDEPAADLSVAFSLISGMLDKPVPDSLIAFGEIGLSGEIRAVSNTESRVREAARLGFSTILLPGKSVPKLQPPEGVTLCGVRNIYELLKYLKDHEKQN